ncbi:hypothetical protein QUF79_13125 [Fictibacillus enclensis]|uniref:hypothetical protein n=1 Tax=Fictibacillus enclensis TaxID=1017270 RepID=UPI0025A07E9B|nr:hypothetical protein [Fictibacillus enclensis]MDM5198965.1 hypothetical protein [Fictibacillus enclensis]
MPQKNIPKEELIDLYINQVMSIADIGKIYNCSRTAVTNRLKENNIPIRSPEEARKRSFERKLGFSLTSKKIMEQINEGMLAIQVADHFGVGHGTILKTLQKDGIHLSQMESYVAMKNSKVSRERWKDKESPQIKKQREIFKEINKKKTEAAQLKYETAHLKSYKEYKRACARIVDKIFGTDRPDGMQYDHKYSVMDGHKNGVPAPILSHPSNIRLITAFENNSKGNDSIVTLEELYKGAGEPWDPARKEIKRVKNCDYCGKEFPQRNKNQRFCNKKCNGNWQYHNKLKYNYKIVNKNCVICGTPFITKATEPASTCKPHCAGKLRHKTRAKKSE